MAALALVHEWLGYLVSVAMLAAMVTGVVRGREGREFRPRPFVLTVVALDVQVLLGLLRYGLDGAWDARAEIAYLHPVAGIAALVVAHVALRRARSERMAVDAHRTAVRGLVVTFLLLIVAIGLASAPPFL